MKKLRHIIQTLLGFALVAGGLYVFFVPIASEMEQDKETKQFIEDFNIEYYGDKEATVLADDTEKILDESESDDADTTQVPITRDSKESDPLYQEILAYNQNIYNSGQADFKDAWSYTQSPLNISRLENGKFGYIRIPALGKTFSLYLGASMENMARGAAVLGQTSIPIGGVNTNSVIAGHRGWSTGSFFKHIEKIKVGDYIFITNPWETLAYKVSSIDIIDPYDNDKVKIQEDKDMVTLITCHPYGSHGNKYRYLVYCERDANYDFSVDPGGWRDTSDKSVSLIPDPSYDDTIPSSSGTQYASSEQEIQTEEFARLIGCVVIIMGFLFVAISLIKNKKRRK